MLKNPPADAGDAGSIPGQEDPLEKEMATTPVFLPGKSQEQKNLVGYSPWGCKEPDTTERQLHSTTAHFVHSVGVQVLFINSLGRKGGRG